MTHVINIHALDYQSRSEARRNEQTRGIGSASPLLRAFQTFECRFICLNVLSDLGADVVEALGEALVQARVGHAAVDLLRLAHHQHLARLRTAEQKRERTEGVRRRRGGRMRRVICLESCMSGA